MVSVLPPDFRFSGSIELAPGVLSRKEMRLPPAEKRLMAHARKRAGKQLSRFLSRPQRAGERSRRQFTKAAPELFPDFAVLLKSGEDEATLKALRKVEATGRPLGDAAWLLTMESRTGRRSLPGKRGPKLKLG